jgi:hypothetical protein
MVPHRNLKQAKTPRKTALLRGSAIKLATTKTAQKKTRKSMAAVTGTAAIVTRWSTHFTGKIGNPETKKPRHF